MKVFPRVLKETAVWRDWRVTLHWQRRFAMETCLISRYLSIHRITWPLGVVDSIQIAKQSLERPETRLQKYHTFTVSIVLEDEELRKKVMFLATADAQAFWARGERDEGFIRIARREGHSLLAGEPPKPYYDDTLYYK